MYLQCKLLIFRTRRQREGPGSEQRWDSVFVRQFGRNYQAVVARPAAVCSHLQNTFRGRLGFTGKDEQDLLYKGICCCAVDSLSYLWVIDNNTT